jgi:hypothetical protein
MFVISTPRTGSTLYCELNCDKLLDDTLSSKLGTGLYNREIFDTSMYSQQIIFERFEVYKGLDNPPLIKVFPGMTPVVILEWLLENKTPIWIERKNKLDQICSWGLGQYTKKWNTKRNAVLNSLYYEKPDYMYITSVIEVFLEYKEKYLKDYKICYTEDILSQDIVSTQHLPQKNSETDKIDYFINKQEILNWYASRTFI